MPRTRRGLGLRPFPSSPLATRSTGISLSLSRLRRRCSPAPRRRPHGPCHLRLLLRVLLLLPPFPGGACRTCRPCRPCRRRHHLHLLSLLSLPVLLVLLVGVGRSRLALSRPPTPARRPRRCLRPPPPSTRRSPGGRDRGPGRTRLTFPLLLVRLRPPPRTPPPTPMR